ncbi:MAG: hypothetical protein ACO1N0_21790 [Fluviicola sp.]
MKTPFLILLLFLTSVSTAQTFDNLTVQQVIQEGDSLVQNKQYLQALKVYEKACSMDSTQCPTEKIASVQEILKRDSGCEGGESIRIKIIEVADKCFRNKEYVKAKELYQRALLIRPGDEYPKKQIGVIDKLLSEK